ncbi:MAG TPA: hypothetical protein VKB65_00450 [Myxococcota bacterium]|nr:hypothetical protein [Myxococcota bacterium]
MIPRLLALAAVALLCLPGCGPEAPRSDETTPEPGPAAFSGTWRVRGRTVEKRSHQGRDIDGTVVIAAEGDGYRASFELTTLFPTSDGPTEAQVVGTGAGRVEDGSLQGTADTQIILAQVPGVDAEFGFLPRRYGPRITSRSVATLAEDGSLTIEIENEGVEGSSYRGTRTSVTGTRIETASAASDAESAPLDAP